MPDALDSLPHGLTVFKKRRDGAPARPLDALPAGSCPWEVWPEDYHWAFYCRVRRPGVPGVVKSLETDNADEAAARALLVFRRATAAKWETAEQAFDKAMGKPVFATIGQIIRAYLEVYPKRTRNTNDLRAVIGWGMGWRKEGDRWEDDSPESRRVDALCSGEVLRPQMVLKYYLIRGGSYEQRVRANISYNGTLCNARAVFGSGPLAICYRDLVLPPDLQKWQNVPLLKEPEIDREGEMLTAAQFAAIVARARELEQGTPAERELALVNKIYRRLGLRPIEVEAAQREWMEERNGEWYLALMNASRGSVAFEVKNGRVGRLRLGRVDDPDSLAAALVPRSNGFLILPDATMTERRRLVRDAHNRLVKDIAGETYNGQGNYRLRKYAGTMVRRALGIEAAALHLRDSEKVAKEHYTIPDSTALPLITDAVLLG